MRLRLCVVFLDKGMPLPAKHALIRSRTGALSVTELTAWTTSNDLLDKFQARIDLMEKLIEPTPFMCGDQISIADLAFPATFTLAELMLPVFARELRFGPRVQAWRETIYNNPVVKAITDESRQATLDWMNSGGG